MLRSAVLALACAASPAFAGEIAWTDADKAELAKLAKRAKKNGDLFVVAGPDVEARLPTREAAAEFQLYLQRLAFEVTPLWGTRESTMFPLTVEVMQENTPWPSSGKGRKFCCDPQYKSTGGQAPVNVLTGVNLWIDPSLSTPSLSVASIQRNELNCALVCGLVHRLGGKNDPPAWLREAMFNRFMNWSPIATEPATRGGAKPQAPAKYADADPTDDLMKWFESSKDEGRTRESDILLRESFFCFMLEHKKGREFFTEVCESISRGRKVEIDRKALKKLVPHWREWAGFPAPAAK